MLMKLTPMLIFSLDSVVVVVTAVLVVTIDVVDVDAFAAVVVVVINFLKRSPSFVALFSYLENKSRLEIRRKVLEEASKQRKKERRKMLPRKKFPQIFVENFFRHFVVSK
jgi:hypothetical protein